MTAGEGGDRIIGFYSLPIPSLADRGILGERPEVYCFGDRLEVRGEGGGVFAIPARTVRLLRFGVGGSRSGIFHMARVLTDGSDEQLCLRAANRHCPGYRDTMRRFAEAVAEARGLDALEHGTTEKGSLAQLVAATAVALIFSYLGIVYWSREHGMTGALVFAAIMAGVVALFAWEYFVNDRPGPIRSLDEIDKYLPKRQ